jgi:hypothetical protein
MNAIGNDYFLESLHRASNQGTLCADCSLLIVKPEPAGEHEEMFPENSALTKASRFTQGFAKKKGFVCYKKIQKSMVSAISRTHTSHRPFSAAVKPSGAKYETPQTSGK